MSAGRYNILLEQGATFSLPLIYRDSDGNPVDLSTYTAALQVRKTPGGPVLFELTTENGGIVLGTTDGTITLGRLATETALFPAGSYVYDLKLIVGLNATRLLEGEFNVAAAVTV